MNNALTCIRHFIDGETGDYHFFEKYTTEDIEQYGDWTYCTVDFPETNHDVRLRVKNIQQDEYLGLLYDMEVEMSEDVWEKCNDYDWTSKHFWMALLTWEAK